MSKSKIGFLVEGRTEQEAFRKRLNRTNHEFVIRIRNLNGKNVPLERIANQCLLLLRALSYCQLTFIVLDREKRKEDVSEISRKISQIILKEHDQRFVVVIADIMFENWLVADIEQIQKKHSDLIKQKVINKKYDGQNGEALIKRYLKKYNKTLHGPQFFKIIRKNKAIANSPSFAYFMEQLDQNQITIP